MQSFILLVLRVVSSSSVFFSTILKRASGLCSHFCSCFILTRCRYVSVSFPYHRREASFGCLQKQLYVVLWCPAVRSPAPSHDAAQEHDAGRGRIRRVGGEVRGFGFFSWLSDNLLTASSLMLFFFFFCAYLISRKTNKVVKCSFSPYLMTKCRVDVYSMEDVLNGSLLLQVR